MVTEIKYISEGKASYGQLLSHHIVLRSLNEHCIMLIWHWQMCYIAKGMWMPDHGSKCGSYLNNCHKVGDTWLSRRFLYAEAL